MRAFLLYCLVASLAIGAYAHHGNEEDHHEKNIDTHFSQCFCWDNATNNFCGGDNFQNSDACQKLAIESFGWFPVYIIAAFATLFFPCCFYASRCACRCCGGRHSTRGCCCSDEASRADFPGYRNRSIVCTKIFFTACFLGTVTLAVHVYVQNARLSPDILNVVRDVNNTFEIYSTTLNSANAAVASLSSAPYQGVISPDLIHRVDDVARKAAKDLHSAFDIVKHVKDAEQKARAPVTYNVPSIALLFLLITFVLMLFNLRKGVGIIMVCTCLSLFLVMTLTAVNGTVAVVTNVICPNFQTAENVVVGAVRAAGACDNAGFVSDFKQVKTGAMELITNANSPFCQDVQAACNMLQNGCPVTTCANGATYNTPTAVQPMTTLFEANLAVAQIAAAIAAVDTAAAKNVIAMRQTFAAAATAEMSFPFVTTCGPLVNVLRTQLKPDLCNEAVNHHSGAVTGFSGGMVGCLIIAIFFQIRGMKRFRPLNSYKEYSEMSALISEPVADSPVVVANVYYDAPRQVHGVVVVKELNCDYGSIKDRC